MLEQRNFYRIENMVRTPSSRVQRQGATTRHRAALWVLGKRALPKVPLFLTAKEYADNEETLLAKVRVGEISIVRPSQVRIDSLPNGRLIYLVPGKPASLIDPATLPGEEGLEPETDTEVEGLGDGAVSTEASEDVTAELSAEEREALAEATIELGSAEAGTPAVLGETLATSVESIVEALAPSLESPDVAAEAPAEEAVAPVAEVPAEEGAPVPDAAAAEVPAAEEQLAEQTSDAVAAEEQPAQPEAAAQEEVPAEDAPVEETASKGKSKKNKKDKKVKADHE